jgi:hypothetical protein
MSEKPWEMFIVLEEGRPAVLKGSKVWNRCIFRSVEDAVQYAEYWGGKALAGRTITNKEWFEGVNVSIYDTPCIVKVDTILVDVPAGISSLPAYPPGVRGGVSGEAWDK